MPPDVSQEQSLQAQIEESARRLGEAMKGKDVSKNLLKAHRIITLSWSVDICLMLGVFNGDLFWHMNDLH